MALLIDPARWPAHGTVFSHLISDSSLQELHSFARAQGISERAFDRDHYDVPAHLCPQLIDAGAQPVSGSELTRRLQASGLRVPLKERPEKIRKGLLARWETLAPGAEQLGEDILDRWQEPHRAYHNSAHLLEMLGHAAYLAGDDELPRAVLLAIWLHDVIYEGKPGADEEASATFARHRLAHHQVAGEGEIEAVARLIEATAAHQPPQAHEVLQRAGISQEHWQIFFDADLAILAAETARYRRYATGVRQEYSRVSDDDFRQGRARVLQGLLERPSIFTTRLGRRAWEAKARENIAAELKELTYSARPCELSGESKAPERQQDPE